MTFADLSLGDFYWHLGPDDRSVVNVEGITDTTPASPAPPPPSSPPTVTYDGVVANDFQPTHRASNSNTTVSSHEREKSLAFSPDTARLRPRTPGSIRSKAPSSAYYTAVWGSPYDVSPSQLSRSARTAVSEQEARSDLDLNSSPSFTLEHLVPSRLSDLSYPDSEVLPRSEEYHTPRSRTQRWVQLPVRDDQSEAIHWWSDESVPSRSNSESRRRQDQRESTPTRRRSERGGARPGHNSREQNRTLDQQSFWDTLRGEQTEGDSNMASLMESRWAATPETKSGDVDVESSEKGNGKKEDAGEKGEEEGVVEVTGMGASRWADTTDPEEEKSTPNAQEKKNHDPMRESGNSTSNAQEKENQDPLREPGKAPKARDIEALAKELASQKRPVASGKPMVNNTSAGTAATGSPTAEKQTETKVSITPPEASTPVSNTSPLKTPQLQRNESTQGLEAPRPRLKTRVSWRGRNIVIAIPRHDYAAAGAERPMSREEIAARLQHFEQAGYDTSGFDLEQDVTQSQGPAQVRSIFPDEAETRQIWDQDKPKVVLPDLDQWKRYMDWLTEQKLAALGVSLGFDDPSPLPTQEMSRQSSGQYPPLPFSPPIPTGSAGSMRPMGRGHSHTMSVASPVSPMGGPMFGHAHRHSTFTGAPMNHFQMPHQQPLLSPNLSGMPPYSPQQHFVMPRGGSPAQLTALRQDLGNMRGPGSPLGQHMMSGSPQDYSRGMMDQQRRQHGYSQSMAAPVMRQSPQPQQLPQARYTPAPLPELPEEDDEEELREQESEPEPQAYVPPQKRVQVDTEIVVPTPRGHRHNISDALEREVLETERPPVPAKMPEQTNSFFPPRGTSLQNQNMLPPLPKPVEKDPLSADYDVHESPRASKKSAARLNVAAPAFTFNPGAVFEPGNAEFTFGAPATKKPTVGHKRDVSSGSLNVNAPSFKPATSEFSFSSVVPPSAKKAAEEPKRTIVDDLPSIFDLGKIKIPDIVKPTRRNKAIPILPPEESDGAVSSAATSGTEYEDADGRVAQGEAKRKQKKKVADDGDSVPLFAEPSEVSPPITLLPEQMLGSNVVERAVDETTEDVTETTIEEVDEPEEINELDAGPVIVESVKAEAPQAVTGATEQTHTHRHSTSLSALAKPFEPPVGIATTTDDDEPSHEHSYSSISELEDGELEDGEIRDDDTTASTLLRSDNLSIAERDFAHPQANIKNVQEFHPEPSFDEIDAVMMQLNAQESEEKESSPVRLPSPGSHPMKGVTYLADWHRSDGPTPSPRRRLLEENTISGANGWGVHQLNRAEDVPTSDWSDMLSPVDEAKLQARGAFFDSHIAEVIGRAMHARLAPLEELILSRNNNVSRRPKSSGSSKSKRTHSNVQSDADDEDDLSGDRKQRPISRGREKRVDQIKVAVLEALREQMPPQDKTAGEIQELHSALADMKISFARAASANLELDDIRAIVEDTMTRQTQAMSQALVTTPDGGEEKDHKRQLSELQGRLNETLAGALEEANQRRAIEEKEAESRRQLRLAQEELQLLRDSVRDDESKERAMEQEREELISRLQVQGEALRSAEDKLEDTEAQNEALQATLSEYRTSSKKWREDIEEGKRVREELENTLSLAQRQAEDSQDATSGMRRRLEKLHADMATAVGQLASEKAAWKAREEESRSKVESLEERLMVSDRGRIALDEELRTVRVAALEASEARHTLDHVRESNASLEEMNRKLQSELAEQRGLAAHYERQWQHAQESGQAEVNRVNISKESEVEAAKLFVRAELEMELTKARTEIENLRMEAENTKERHAHMLEQEESLRREALRKTNHSNSVALDEARHKYEANVQDLTSQHSRALRHALEDKDRLEHLLSEKLSLSNAKVQHFQERVMHLEERLEVTKSAAQAAASSARGGKAVAQPQWQPSGVPEKISPQALRESILVLQEQLQERETRIERLQAHAEGEGATKLKQRDDEINFLRELLAVRNEELTDLVNTISKPNFDRAAVRDNAIRIRANLQMEQQEKDRFRPASPSQNQSQNESPVGSALASLTSLATPKAAQLSSAFSKWRSNMESSALKAQQQRQQQLRSAAASGRRSYTPSKPAPASSAPAGYHEGLMTPPASNVRSSPIPEDDKGILPPPRLHPRTGSSTSNKSTPRKVRGRRISDDDDDDGRVEEGSTTPLFREQSYDRDAEDSGVTMREFEEDGMVDGEEGDDSLEDIDDEGPPAFRRSLEEELGRQ
ncbi:unnamed protein product [Zymoseptoria tritici ST99CH_3D7]|uniref:Uncharacterized protein n=1 Tax=Zymoseptoria tritici (strain ST99CH_3D7) TaxID=1276538 RepID=A0A1X7RII8_ZYMT9|nr:unnamed protein product [Zymoseptoria tritici ST99CH_3D7]